jgi:hypothetical protein
MTKQLRIVDTEGKRVLPYKIEIVEGNGTFEDLELPIETEDVTIPTASTTVQGIVELATSAEATTGTDTARAVTPKALADSVPEHVPAASETVAGKVELATATEIAAGTAGKVVDAAGLAAAVRIGRDRLYLSWVDDDTIQVGIGGCTFSNGGKVSLATAVNVTFANLDTGVRTLGRDYSVHATPDGIKLHLIPVDNSGLGALYPSGYTASNTRLLGYFHNGKDYVGGGADGAIFQYSVTSNDLLNENYPYRAHPDLPAGVPLPGMVKCGGFAIGIYQASREDATASAEGTSVVPTSRYGVVPWCSIQGFEANAVAAAAGCRLPTIWEWWMAAMFNPGSATLVARQNGNSGYGSSSDGGGYLAAPGALTSALAGLGAGALSAGLYKYRVTLVNTNGETQGGTADVGTTVVDPATDGQIALTAPTGGAGTTARKLYRTVAGGGIYKYLATIPDNTTVIYTDNVADITLGTTVLEYNTTGAQQGAPDPTCSGRTLVGTGPRIAGWGAPGANVSWYSAACLAAGLYSGVGYGTSSDWGYGDGDSVWNVDSYGYQPQRGGWTVGLPTMALLGGYWGDGSFAGVRSVYFRNSPGVSNTYFGFRAAR